jgi:hypothetical protein
MRLGLALFFVVFAMTAHASEPKTPTQRLQELQLVQAFDCRNVSCKRLRSCQEACYKLVQCGQGRRDGDNDGIPCENLCSRRCE